MKRFMNNQGFTLIELIIVMVILSIMIAFAVPRYSQYIKTSKVNGLKNDTELAARAIVAAYGQNQAWPADAAAVNAYLSKDLCANPATTALPVGYVAPAAAATTCDLSFAATLPGGAAIADFGTLPTAAPAKGGFYTNAAGTTLSYRIVVQ